ncbi:hypothetical protein RRG08_029061 [Elysia crispata]|uniref:Uncharacterized protein n=1 Tax=Elysia crispata TaxID=231223 RepID=A0AAE1DHP6_9GAST|nr:hypothetical protein RRG08_029061 [Elysia crispata]
MDGGHSIEGSPLNRAKYLDEGLKPTSVNTIEAPANGWRERIRGWHGINTADTSKTRRLRSNQQQIRDVALHGLSSLEELLSSLVLTLTSKHGCHLFHEVTIPAASASTISTSDPINYPKFPMNLLCLSSSPPPSILTWFTSGAVFTRMHGLGGVSPASVRSSFVEVDVKIPAITLNIRWLENIFRVVFRDVDNNLVAACGKCYFYNRQFSSRRCYPTVHETSVALIALTRQVTTWKGCRLRGYLSWCEGPID